MLLEDKINPCKETLGNEIHNSPLSEIAGSAADSEAQQGCIESVLVGIGRSSGCHLGRKYYCFPVMQLIKHNSCLIYYNMKWQ